MDTSNRLHVFVENYGGTPANSPFVDGPAISNTSLDPGSDSDMIHLVVNENGSMISQRYFTSAGGDFILEQKQTLLDFLSLERQAKVRMERYTLTLFTKCHLL